MNLIRDVSQSARSTDFVNAFGDFRRVITVLTRELQITRERTYYKANIFPENN